jgi:GntR family transcriptional repressor for pyruvate dehydrogenase complex
MGDGPRTRAIAVAAISVERVQPSYVQVAAQLRSLILGRQLAAGERLPAESELASMFGVSRSTTREALRLLAAENLIQTRRGVTGGTFVVHPNPRDMELALSTAIDLAAGTDHLSLDEVFEVWQMMEVPAAGLAARRRTAADIARINALAGAAPAGMTEGEQTLRAMAFHRAVLDAAGNRLLDILVRPLAALGPRTLVGTHDIRAYVGEADLRHRGIADAIAAGDEELAMRLMAQDLARPGEHQAELAAERSGFDVNQPTACTGAAVESSTNLTPTSP